MPLAMIRTRPRFIETAHRLGYRFVGQTAHTNLPARLSSLVGRQREIADVAHTLELWRLLTLVGAGGSGKSRLALEVPDSARAERSTTVSGGSTRATGATNRSSRRPLPRCGLREQPGQSLTHTLRWFLAPRDVLLVVDNCEHVIGASASLLQELLLAAPRLRVLAMSREPLRSDGERVFLVPPLSVPDARECSSLDRALEDQSVRLFAERARAALPSFVLSAWQLPAPWMDICRHLDGLPLAIELAAPRVRALSACADCRSVLDDCCRPARQRSPHRAGSSPDAASGHRLELRPAHRSRAPGCCAGCRSSSTASRWRRPGTWRSGLGSG